MPKVKKIEEVEAVNTGLPEGLPPISTRKEELLALYEQLRAEGINSIGDLENKIARL